MRAKILLKKLISVVCVVALTVTSLTARDVIKVLGDTSTTVVLSSDTTRADLLAEIKDEEINFALNKEASVSKLTTQDGGTDLGIITNGAFATGNSASTIIEIGRGIKEDRWIQVDLGKAYDASKIDRVAVMYKTLNSGPSTATLGTYYIQYSINGIDYVDVASVSGQAGNTNAIFLDQITLTEEQKEAIPYARYVRIYVTRDLSAYGMQVKGMAVLTDGTTKVSEVDVKEVEKLDNAASVKVTSSDYCQLEYSFEASEGHEDYEYYAYIDGAKQDEAKTPNTSYTVTGLTSGEHTVKIVSVKEGLTSDGISEKVIIADPKDLMTTDRNIAIGATATPSSIRDEDNPANLTDGLLNTQFRTAVTDTESSILIDLGSKYKRSIIEMIAVQYIDNRYAKNYTVEYSEDGEYFETVCEAEGNANFQYSKIYPTDCTINEVRYVKLNVSNPVTAGYGFQFYEIAVITKDKTLDDATIKLNSEEYTYTGTAIEPDVTVIYGEKSLTKGKDYTLSCENNVNVGTANVTIEGSGSFAGIKNMTYSIVAADIQNTEIGHSFDENGNICVDVKYNDIDLENDKDYTYITEKNEDDNMLITVSAKSENFTGTKTYVVNSSEFPVAEAANISVESSDLNKIDVSFSNPNTFAGEKQTYNIYIDDSLVDENVVAGSYSYEKQDAGEHVVMVTAKLNGQLSEGVTKQVTVSGMDIDEYADIVLDKKEDESIADTYVYTGLEISPVHKVVAKGTDNVLEEGTDYTVTVSDNVNVGIAEITITGKGLYEGTKFAQFEITPKSIENVEVDYSQVAESYVATGEAIVPQITIPGLTADIDYTVEVTNNINPGIATIIIKGIGNYNSQVKKEFTISEPPTTEAPVTAQTVVTTKSNKIVVKKATVKRVAKKKNAKKINLVLKKVAGATKYQVKISTTKKFKKILVSKNVKKIKVTIKHKSLANKKKLYIKVRALKVVNGKLYKGAWSDAKKIVIKK